MENRGIEQVPTLRTHHHAEAQRLAASGWVLCCVCDFDPPERTLPQAPSQHPPLQAPHPRQCQFL